LDAAIERVIWTRAKNLRAFRFTRVFNFLLQCQEKLKNF